MFKNDSTENLLEDLEQELAETIELVEPKKPTEPPIKTTRLFDPFEESPKPVARQKSVILNVKSLGKNEKNDENEIIQLSSVSSDASKSLSGKNDNLTQDSSLVFTSSKINTVVLVNEKKAPKKIDVQVHSYNIPEITEDGSIFVIKHGKWANETVEKPEILPIEEDISVKSAKKVPGKVIKKQKISKKVTHVAKEQSSYSSSSATSQSMTTPNTSSEEDIVEVEKSTKKPKKKKNAKKEKLVKKNNRVDASSDGDATLGENVSESGESEKQSEVLQDDDHQVIGIYLHDTGILEYMKTLKRPTIKISFINEDNGNLLQTKSTKETIEPVTSKKGRLNDDFHSLICTWNDFMMINEDIKNMKEMYNNVLVFFELINEDNIKLCFAFLKLFSTKHNFTNIDHKFQLQLFAYQKFNKRLLKGKFKKDDEKVEFTIFEQWQLSKIKFKSYLNITVKSMHKNEEKVPDSEEKKEELQLIMNESLNKQWRKLPGQACKIPNQLLHKIMLQEKGSLNIKFSYDGNFLAYTEILRTGAVVLHIKKFPEMTDVFTLREHTDLIHDIDWLKKTPSSNELYPIFLLTSSSDHTVIVWKLEANDYTYSILPHPNFIYASKFLYNDDSERIYVVTGGRDAVLRIWRSRKKRQSFELCQELGADDVEGSKGYYITGISAANNEFFYSSNSVGGLTEWKYHNRKYSVTRKFLLKELVNKTITCIDLHPRGNKLYLKLFDFLEEANISVIYVFSIPSGLIIQKYCNPNSINITNVGLLQSKLRMSPCGTHIFASNLQNRSLISCFKLVNGNINTNQDEENFLNVKFHMGEKNFISSIDYHPKDFYLAFSVYGKNGGIGVFGFEMDINFKEKVDQLQHLLPKVAHFGEIKQFSDIIRRLDEVFLIPNENVIFKPEPAKRTVKVENEIDETYTVNSKRSQTYTVSNEDFEPVKPSTNIQTQESLDNKTYSIKKDDNTFDVPQNLAQNNNSDDTTISQSLN